MFIGEKAMNFGDIIYLCLVFVPFNYLYYECILDIWRDYLKCDGDLKKLFLIMIDDARQDWLVFIWFVIFSYNYFYYQFVFLFRILIGIYERL